MNTPTTQAGAERQAAIAVIQAIAECLRGLGQVPSGHFYNRLMAMPGMSSLSVTQYQALIGALKGAGLVTEKGYLLTWIGPK